MRSRRQQQRRPARPCGIRERRAANTFRPRERKHREPGAEQTTARRVENDVDVVRWPRGLLAAGRRAGLEREDRDAARSCAYRDAPESVVETNRRRSGPHWSREPWSRTRAPIRRRRNAPRAYVHHQPQRATDGARALRHRNEAHRYRGVGDRSERDGRLGRRRRRRDRRGAFVTTSGAARRCYDERDAAGSPPQSTILAEPMTALIAFQSPLTFDPCKRYTGKLARPCTNQPL